MANLLPELDVEIKWMMDCKEITFLPDTNFAEMRTDISKVWLPGGSQDVISPPQAKIKDLLRQVEKTTNRHLAAIEKLYSINFMDGPDETKTAHTYIPNWLEPTHQNLINIKNDVDALLAVAPAKFKSGTPIDTRFLEDIKKLSDIFEKYTGNKATSQSVSHNPNVSAALRQPTEFQIFARSCFIGLGREIILAFEDKINKAMVRIRRESSS